MRRRRLRLLASVSAPILGAMALLVIPHLSPMAGRDSIASLHGAWTRVVAPGMQFPAGRLSLRVVKMWIAALNACCLPRLISLSRFIA